MVDSGPARDVDPVTVEVVRHYFQSTANQMRKDLVRTAYNTIVYEILDFGISVYDADLNLVASAPGLEVIALGNDYSIRKTVEHVGTKNLQPDDVVLMNYPYWNTRQPNDACLVAPIFHDGKVVHYLLVRSHWLDIGAKESGYVMDSTNVYQEGTVFPGVKLYDAGEPVEDIFDIIRFNSRLPEKVLGDVNAKVTALKTGQQRLRALYEKYDADTIAGTVEHVQEHGARKARRAVEDLPDGSWSAETHLDTDGITADPVRMAVTVTVDGDGMRFDFSDSDDVVEGPINVPIGMTEGVCKFWLKRLTTPDEPLTEGHYAPLEAVVAPEGNLFNATHPDPTFTVFGVIQAVELVLKALAEGLPERVMAGSGGDLSGIMLVGEDEATGEKFADALNQGTGWGATNGRDGQSALIHISEAGARNIPVEVWERMAPVRFERLELRRDSGGVGRHRGGLGVRRDYLFTDTVDVLGMPVSTRREGWGLEGGGPGARNAIFVRPRSDWADRIDVTVDNDDLFDDDPFAAAGDDSGDAVDGDAGDPFAAADGDLKHPGMLRGTFEAGERLSNLTGGGGGYGDPHERDPERVLADVREGYVSREAAREDYGVVVTDEGTVDRAATEDLRSDAG